MGGSNSTQNHDHKTKATSQCRFCAGVLKGELKKHDIGDLCTRCGALVRIKKSKSTVPKKEGYDTLDMKDEEDIPQLALSRLHILPFKDTLPTEEDKDTGEEALLKNYILPYFYEKKPLVRIGDRFQIQSIDFRVMSCHPPEGVVTTETKIRAFGNPLGVDNKVNKLHVLPLRSSLPDWKADSKKYSEEVLFANYLKPYFGGEEPRYVTEGDTFIQNGIQFKIIACEPKDGEVVKETKVFNHGEPLQDLNKIHILPIYETLPNHHKELSEQKLMELYLFPYFSGRFRACVKDEEIDIDGVDFKVMAVDPEGVPGGVVTDSTRLYANGPFIRYSELKQQQLQADEDLARALQRQESVVPTQALVMQARLEDLLRRMPQNDPHRPMILRINQSLALLPYLSRDAIDRNIIPMLSNLSSLAGDPSNTAAPQDSIESLPTRIYQPKKQTADSKNSDDEFNTCRICLMDYEAGEELRTLPCFHAYHKTCIDKWLQTNRKCPICKNPITSA